MLWLLAALAIGVAGGWWLARRSGPPRIQGPPETKPLPRKSGPPDARTTLRRAFHSDEYQVPEDVLAKDRELLAEALQLLADHVTAADVVLWQLEPGGGGHLRPLCWVPAAEPPIIADGDQLLLQLSAESGAVTFNTSGALRVMASAVRADRHTYVVSAHFRERPTLENAALERWLQQHAASIVSRHEILQHRGILSQSTFKLRNALRTATTLQGSRDPEALEQMLADNASEIAGGSWALIVRWDSAKGNGRVVQRSAGCPDIGEGVVVTAASMVGRVCAGLDASRVSGDTRPLIVAKEALLDDTPVPSGTRALVIAPLRRAENLAPVGALVVGKTGQGAFSEPDIGATKALGTLGAGALETAWAMRDEAERALTDQLTGLPNRRAFQQDFVRFVAETDRYGGASALVMVDVDHFKAVNDTHGHEVGDRVLQAVANVLLAQRRTTDRVARLGGEEMALLLPQTDAVGATEVAERCRQAIADATVNTARGPVRVTASFGVAVYRARSQGGDRLYDRADRALYAAKHAGRNRVELADDE